MSILKTLRGISVHLGIACAGDLVVAQSADPLADFRAVKEAVIKAYRTEGVLNLDPLARQEPSLRRIIDAGEEYDRASALLELGTARRLQNDFSGAISAYQDAVRLAQSVAASALVFDSEIGIARAYEYGTREHGPAAEALERARVAAGGSDQQTPKHRYKRPSITNPKKTTYSKLRKYYDTGRSVIRRNI